MSLKDTWTNKTDGVDDVVAEDINSVAQAVISVEDNMVDVENVANKVTSINETSTDVQYPTAKAVVDYVGNQGLYMRDYINNELAGKADKSTTLNGYGITDAYTKAQTDEVVDNLGYTLRVMFHLVDGHCIYDERVDNGHYIKVVIDGSTNDGKIRRLTYGTPVSRQITWTQLLEQFTGTPQTSPAGVDNCIYMGNAAVLNYDTQNDTFVMNGTPDRDPSIFVPVLWSYYGALGGMLLESEFDYRNKSLKNIINTFNSNVISVKTPGLEDGEKAFLSLYANSGDTLEPFMYFTDPHVMDMVSEQQKARYINYMHKVSNDIHFSCVICGGDWMDSSQDIETHLYKLGLVKGFMSKMFTNAHLCVGNHDTNFAVSDKILTPEQIAKLWNPQIGKCYYGFSGYNTKFYILDTRIDGSDSTYTKEQLSWLCNELQSGNDSNIAIAMHIMFKDSAHTVLSHMGQKLSEIITAFNTRATYIFESTTYDFSNAAGKIRFTMAGHTHKQDEQMVGGVPCILLNKVGSNDGYTPRCAGMLADYDNNKLHIVAFGDMVSKTIDI